MLVSRGVDTILFYIVLGFIYKCLLEEHNTVKNIHSYKFTSEFEFMSTFL